MSLYPWNFEEELYFWYFIIKLIHGFWSGLEFSTELVTTFQYIILLLFSYSESCISGQFTTHSFHYKFIFLLECCKHPTFLQQGRLALLQYDLDIVNYKDEVPLLCSGLIKTQCTEYNLLLFVGLHHSESRNSKEMWSYVWLTYDFFRTYSV